MMVFWNVSHVVWN